MKKRAQMQATRKEQNLELQVTEGTLPADIYGHVYVMAPVGTVNSGGLPIPEYEADGSTNNEYGSPVMNGDGMAWKVSFVDGKVHFLSRLMKTPCYYADEATKKGTDHPNGFAFSNLGIVRMSPMLGARNQLNTALVPFQFKHQKTSALIATYDAGRPFVADASTLGLKTPIGKSINWKAATPPLLKPPFRLVQSTAHPVFDPATDEVFTVNFTKSTATTFGNERVLQHMRHNPKHLEHRMHGLAEELRKVDDKEEASKKVDTFFGELEEPPAPFESWWMKMFYYIFRFFLRIFAWFINFLSNLFPFSRMVDSVYLVRWDGKNEPKRWELRDENGDSIQINQCMHQVAVTRDYILLIDASFKFSIDLMITNPFPHNATIDQLMRGLLTEPMEPFTRLYIVKRSDLINSAKRISVKTLSPPLPLECVHFSADYANPEGKIVLYTAHNSAACVAEWLRPYDINKLTGQPIDKEMVGMFALGDMDIGRIGKFIIDAEKGSIKEDFILSSKGNPDNPEDIGPQTWGMGLYTHYGLLPLKENVETINNIFFVSYGLDNRMLSDFIYDLYEDYPNREVSTDEMLLRTKQGIPYTLERLDTKQMKLVDYFQMPMHCSLYSVQFMPRKEVGPTEDPSLAGYIFCTMLVQKMISEGETTYLNEIWIFDASNLKKGPVCKLSNPELDYGFTLHSAWAPEAAPNDLSYNINIIDDYNQMIKQKWFERGKVQRFFNQYVYPHYQKGN